MKILFFLLLFINLFLAAYIQWGSGGNGRMQVAPEIQPEKIKLLSGSAASSVASPAAPAPARPEPAGPGPAGPGPAGPGPAAGAPAAASAPAVCLKWGSFLNADLARAEAALARQQLDDGIRRVAVGKSTGFWVYMPPLRNIKHVERKMGELNRRGVTYYSHVQDDTEWNNSISLGFFSNMEEARNFLALLKSKDVNSAVAEEHSLEQTNLVWLDPPQALVQKLMELKAEFPGSKVEANMCELGMN